MLRSSDVKSGGSRGALISLSHRSQYLGFSNGIEEGVEIVEKVVNIGKFALSPFLCLLLFHQ